ncbi:hypothetical protein LZ578_08735 [Jeotgalibaca sp. MA1X17-3]|uniref:hypothetical protein n=1 Tax=Jeotgalibaca sp. MA1X17-3 TaxID=2908211 RepID=UPI001F2E7289|nr:hypothetical protein [Jeotgalibaca sp. MA1X17-3]UJF15083.1 hypothetical protein LZ578_08735 [Jeotgalibaca sp. MA1X17-3]
MEMDYRLNDELRKMKVLHSYEWYKLPDDHPDNVRIHTLAKEVEWKVERKPFEDIKPWSNRELTYIESSMDVEKPTEIARKLMRPVQSVKSQMYKLRQRIKAKEGYINDRIRHL